MTGKHYDPDLLADFLKELYEKKFKPNNVEISNVNVYIALKSEDGENVEIIKEGKTLNFKTVFEKDEHGNKETVFKEWLI